METTSARIARNLAAVRARMTQACDRAGRDPRNARLVAVTKTVGIEEVKILRDLGVTDFGENRVEDGLAKIEALNDPSLRWHMIGHLQRRKAKSVFPAFSLLHSLDSLLLAEKLSGIGEHTGRDAEVLLEVNISGEATKYGLRPEECSAVLASILRLPRLRIRGLMTMAPWTELSETARPVFRALRELRDRLVDATGVSLPELSMGMSGDFEPAVEEGATLVRIGTALFAPE